MDRGLTRLSGAPTRADGNWRRWLRPITNEVSRDLLRRAKQEHSDIIAGGRTGRVLAGPFGRERVEWSTLSRIFSDVGR